MNRYSPYYDYDTEYCSMSIDNEFGSWVHVNTVKEQEKIIDEWKTFARKERNEVEQLEKIVQDYETLVDEIQEKLRMLESAINNAHERLLELPYDVEIDEYDQGFNAGAASALRVFENAINNSLLNKNVDNIFFQNENGC